MPQDVWKLINKNHIFLVLGTVPTRQCSSLIPDLLTEWWKIKHSVLITWSANPVLKAPNWNFNCVMVWVALVRISIALKKELVHSQSCGSFQSLKHCLKMSLQLLWFWETPCAISGRIHVMTLVLMCSYKT